MEEIRNAISPTVIQKGAGMEHPRHKVTEMSEQQMNLI